MNEQYSLENTKCLGLIFKIKINNLIVEGGRAQKRFETLLTNVIQIF